MTINLKATSLEAHQKACATKPQPGLSSPSRFATRTFSSVVKLFDEGADNTTIEAETKADYKAVIACRQAYAALLVCKPIEKPKTAKLAAPPPIQSIVNTEADMAAVMAEKGYSF